MKTGIVTMFYGSCNYGGILQAYALVKALEKQSIDAEQICYNLASSFSFSKRLRIALRPILYPLKLLIKQPKNIHIFFKISKRMKCVRNAALILVPHSKRVFTGKTIKNCISDYDVFITGSDQVWHGEYPVFFLPFVTGNKKKISYAASTGKSHLQESDIDRIKFYTKDFIGVSVRETDTAKVLGLAIPNKMIEVVLDPTLILDKEDWNNVVTNRKITAPYMFCYFLGPDVRMRELASNYAKRHNLLLLTIPHMQGGIEPNDVEFGDIQSYDATPQDFLSFIKYADVVFTDSFHASVFSQIFQRQYFVFGRVEHKEMNNRIVTLTNLFHTEKRFICENENYSINYIEKIEDIDYRIPSLEYERFKTKSKDFLLHSLFA